MFTLRRPDIVEDEAVFFIKREIEQRGLMPDGANAKGKKKGSAYRGFQCGIYSFHCGYGMRILNGM